MDSPSRGGSLFFLIPWTLAPSRLPSTCLNNLLSVPQIYRISNRMYAVNLNTILLHPAKESEEKGTAKSSKIDRVRFASRTQTVA
jgi:hypothetical protein